MRSKATTAGQSVSLIQPINGVVALWGYGVNVCVEHGDLVVSDGIADCHRSSRISRIAKLRRLVVIGESGTISFAALRWLFDTGAVFVQLGRDGEVIVVSNPPGKDDARLRRAQALAAGSPVGLAIAKELIRRKVDGQRSVMAMLGADKPDVSEFPTLIANASDVQELRRFEADAAARYWQAWRDVPIQWVSKDAKTIPAHWRAFGSRTSPLTNSPRLAVNPANAVLNFIYDGLLEAEARTALVTLGLDPGLGVMHADQWGRDSLALDVMEAVRPAVDAWVLDTLKRHRFSKRDVCQLQDGRCRLLPDLARQVAATLPRWRQAVSPVAEWVATALLGSSVATHLTQDNRSAGRDGLRKGERRQATLDDDLPNACRACGVLIEPERTYCNECLPDVLADHAATWNETARTKLASMRAVGNDPAHAESANRLRGQKNATHVAAVQAWARSSSNLDFARDILPELQAVSLTMMAQATGLSEGYCSFIKRGLKVPHPRHWKALAHISNDVQDERRHSNEHV